MKFWWPVFLIVACSVAYQLGIKEISGGMHPLSALAVTYLSASFTAFVLYFLLAERGGQEEGNFFLESIGPGAGSGHRGHRDGLGLHVPGGMVGPFVLHCQ